MFRGQAHAAGIVRTHRAVGLLSQVPAPDHQRPVAVRDGLQRGVLGALTDHDDAIRS
jgi:hypothetical protein